MVEAAVNRRPPASTLSVSGLLECLADGVAALRTSRAYAEDAAFREVLSSVGDCGDELRDRLAEVRCVPGRGEPAFVLLGRDPEAPAVVRAWADYRDLREPGPKTERARETADLMDEWHARAGGREALGRGRAVQGGDAESAGVVGPSPA